MSFAASSDPTNVRTCKVNWPLTSPLRFPVCTFYLTNRSGTLEISVFLYLCLLLFYGLFYRLRCEITRILKNTLSSCEPGKRSRYSDWLRAGLTRCQISSPDKGLHIRCPGNVFTESLPSNGSTSHIIYLNKYSKNNLNFCRVS
jgi:hypothetical protein